MTLMNGKGIDNAVKRSAYVQLPKNIFGGRISALGFILLGIDASNLRGGIAIPLFLLKQLKVGLRGGTVDLAPASLHRASAPFCCKRCRASRLRCAVSR